MLSYALRVSIYVDSTMSWNGLIILSVWYDSLQRLWWLTIMPNVSHVSSIAVDTVNILLLNSVSLLFIWTNVIWKQKNILILLIKLFCFKCKAEGIKKNWIELYFFIEKKYHLFIFFTLLLSNWMPIAQMLQILIFVYQKVSFWQMLETQLC